MLNKKYQDARKEKISLINPNSFDPLHDGVSSIELWDYMGDDETIARLAWQSRSNQDRNATIEQMDNVIRHMVCHQHTTPMEGCVITFHIKCPLFVVRQWQRHRTQSYNEESRRYVDTTPEYFIPKNDDWKVQSSTSKQGSSDAIDPDLGKEFTIDLTNHCINGLTNYKWLNGKNVTREESRMFLTTNTYTQFFATANLLNWSRFWALRSDPHAQRHIRYYAMCIDSMFEQMFPLYWPKYKFMEQRLRELRMDVYQQMKDNFV